MSLDAFRRDLHGCLKQPITIYLVNRRSYSGILDQVTLDGIYLVPIVSNANNSDINLDSRIETAEVKDNHQIDVTEAFFGPALFFPFAVITSFIAGTALGAAASKPPYPYPPYPPYPPPYTYPGPYPYQRYYW